MKAVLPDVVIAGAPRCGTSTLFGWLAEHPEVLGSTPKETFFLVDRDHALLSRTANFHDHGWQGYARFFVPEAKPAARVRMEGTTHYLYSRTAPRELGRLPSPPHVLFLLRRPSARVYSSFRYTSQNLGMLRPGTTFAQFLSLSEGGDPGRVTDLRWGGAADIWRNDVAYGRYAEWLDEWARHLPRERLHPLLFEDLESNPRAFMRGLALTLGIDPAFYDDFPFTRRNKSYGVRSPAAQRLARRASALLPWGGVRDVLRRGYLRAFTTDDPRQGGSEDPVLLRALDDAYRPFNQRLASEWGLDLSAWNRHDPNR